MSSGQPRVGLERRSPPNIDREIVIPCTFFDLDRLHLLDPLDDDGRMMEIITGKQIPRERRPHEPLTAWVTMAILGLIEDSGPLLPPGMDREQRLDVAREVLTEDELMVVETIAVPRRYREMTAARLARMVRTASDYVDRMWAGCWLILVGWTRSAECSFRDISAMPARSTGELEETIVEAYARKVGVVGRNDVVGWRRVDESYEAQLISWRLGTCDAFYEINGPPPYECVRRTVTDGPGWRSTMRIVPERSRPLTK